MTEDYFTECVKNQHFPRDDMKKQLILKRIMQDFDRDTYTETEVNAIIKNYFEDFALIRRELINFGYVQRDSLKGEYKILKRELEDKDLDKIEQRQQKFEKDEVY